MAARIRGCWLSVTHQDLADWVGATRPAVTRSLQELRKGGLLEFGRGWYLVPDSLTALG